MSPSLISRRSLVSYAAVALGGFAIGQVSRESGARAQDATPDATATRQAELDELHALQTQVTNPPVCTPAPTETPVPPTPTATIVPPSAAGTPLPYGEIWTITVLSIGPAIPGDVTPDGMYMQVSMEVSHSGTSPALPPLFDFQLVDGQGRRSAANIEDTQAILGTRNSLTVGVGETVIRGVIFDVPIDAGTNFVLESPDDPTFRVALTVEIRG
jgi:hypothetical protein